MLCEIPECGRNSKTGIKFKKKRIHMHVEEMQNSLTKIVREYASAFKYKNITSNRIGNAVNVGFRLYYLDPQYQ